MTPITGAVVRADFNAVEAVLHYTRAAHRLGLWESERLLIERFFPAKAAPLLEAGCGAGRATLGLWELGYRDLTAFDFAEELVEQARDLAAQRGATGIRFLHADATKPAQLRALLPSAPCCAAREHSDSASPSVVAGRRSRSAHRPQPTALRAPATGNRPPATGHRFPVTSHRPPATAHRPPPTAHRSPAPSFSSTA